MFLYSSQTFAGPARDLFPFFSNAHNLHRITPESLHFKILTPAPIEMSAGTKIDYRLKLNGIPFGWTSQITVWEPMVRFVDTQIRGPYRRWVHEHSFTSDGEVTTMHDLVDFAAPGGSLIERVFVVPKLRQIFGHRQEILARHFDPVGDATLEFYGAQDAIPLQIREVSR